MESIGPAPRRWPYWLIFFLFIALTVACLALLFNIQQRKEEAKQVFFKLEELDDNNADPAPWAKNFPRQYDSYKRTVDTERTKHGGSEFIPHQKLESDPFLKRLFAGYAFGVDFREERGHAYMLVDQDETERVKVRKQPGACLHCHSAVMPAYRKAGNGDVMEGFKKICAMEWKDARSLVSHPVTCHDCHDSTNIQLRVTRPGFVVGIQALADSDKPVPHLPSIERWRKSGPRGQRPQAYDPNREASRQEMRTFVCAQCHVEYYFKGEGSLVTYPWANGIKVEEMEEYYDKIGFKDWQHADSGAPLLKAQHPEFELWSQGIHARSGVSCADCHMPYRRDGAIKVSDHQVRSPMLNISRACQTCHRHEEKELLARTELIQDRTRTLLTRAEKSVVDLIDQLKEARVKENANPDKVKAAQALHRKAQWRVDFITSENSMGFHASQESARILAEAIDFARQGQIQLLEK